MPVSQPFPGELYTSAAGTFPVGYYPDKLRIKTTLDFDFFMLSSVWGQPMAILESPVDKPDSFLKNQWHIMDIEYLVVDDGNPYYPNPFPINSISLVRKGPMPLWAGIEGIEIWEPHFLSEIEFGPQPIPEPPEVWWNHTQNPDVTPNYGSGWYVGSNPQSPQQGITFVELF